MAITLKEVAATVGVSRITVSRVVNQRTNYVSLKTRVKVQEAIDKLGYRPHRAAQTLVTGKTGVVLLWIHRPNRPYFGKILAQLQAEASSRGYNVMVADPELYSNRAGASFISCPADGVLAVDCASHLTRILRHRYTSKTPLVHLGTNFVRGVDTVSLGLTEAVTKLLHHFLQQGCRKIIHVNFVGARYDTVLPTYLKEMRKAGLPIDVLPCLPEASYAQARSLIISYIKEFGRPEAIFCRNDCLAMGVYRGLCDLNLQVPEDVLLAGCDGIEEVEYLPCPLTTVATPIQTLCSRGWDLLEERMKNPGAPLLNDQLSASLKLRESTSARRRAAV